MKAELLPGEEILGELADEPLTASDDVLNSRYVKGDFRIVTESARYSLAGIKAMLAERVESSSGDGETEPRYKLDPEYQRRHRWNDVRKSRLIESFLINVPVPPVFLYERDLARFEVMDGRQRLTALADFYEDRFKLAGLQYWPELNGRTYSTLPSRIRDGIDRRYISSIILLKETAGSDEQAARLKKIVFERLNSGGVELSSQETRNAVYDGPLNQLCLSLSSNDKFKRLWRIPSQVDSMHEEDGEAFDETYEATVTGRKMFERMEDVELVLRFFAYRHSELFRAGLNRVADSLDRFLIIGNGYPTSVLEGYKMLFEETISFLTDALGDTAFVPGRGRPAKIAYDPIMAIASHPQVRSRYTYYLEHRHQLQQALQKAYADNARLFSGRSTNHADMQSRNDVIRTAFAQAIRTPDGRAGT